MIDRTRYVVSRLGESRDVPGSREVYLPRRTFELLWFLASHPGETFSCEALLQAVWPPEAHVMPRSIDEHVCTIRERLGQAYVETVPEGGYRFGGNIASAEASANGYA